MEKYLYLSATPEAIIASMLPPEDFGTYLAIGSEKRTRGHAIFFEIDMDQVKDIIPMDYINERCVPNPDNSPKKSVYVAIYRALEMIPLDSLKKLYLVTDDGRVLSLEKGEYQDDENEFDLHLYQEIIPVTPRIASSLNPKEFMAYMTGQVEQIRLPKLFFTELMLNGLANDPVKGNADNLPYPNIEHLRDCLIALKYEPQKIKKTVIRFFNGDFLYRTCKKGFFIGEADKMLFYPFPTIEELESKYFNWWKSASITSFK